MPQKNTIKQYSAESYYHIFARGINKQPIFNERADYSYFLGLIERYLTLAGTPRTNRSGVVYPNYADQLELIAYCLMANHFHLLVFQRPPTGIESLMRSLLTSYSKYFNLKYRRVGSLLESRYKAKLIDDDNYLGHVSRYIHMNPRRWKTYTYSSLTYFISPATGPDWLRPQRVSQLFKDEREYLDFLVSYQGRKTELAEIKHYLANQ